jgi:TonB-linked outer membrane protein, SusC/RagA family
MEKNAFIRDYYSPKTQFKQILRILRTTTVLLFAIVLSSSAEESDSQNVFVSSQTGSSMSPQQNNRQITGTITDNSGEPVIGANIVVAGTTNGTTSDIDGKFRLTVPNNAVLKISYVGYLPQEVRVTDGKTAYPIVLREDTEMLEEVVVIGYGQVKRSEVTGSVVSVNTEEMMKRNPLTVGQGLQGAASGVAVYRNSGSPTGDVTIRVRGIATINNSADPLYIIDGIPSGSISFLNPVDIEAIEVLKDASATAIYGSRGSNGVILITTKRGEKGKTRLNLSANYNIVNTPKPFDMLNAYDWVQMARETAQNDNTALTNEAWVLNDSKLNYIDWQKEVSQVALQQNYNLSVTNGGENSRSAYSLGYVDNEGALIASNFKRFTARVSFDNTIKQFIRTGININFNYSQSYGTGSRNSVAYASTIPTMDKMINGVLENTPVKYDNGDWGFFSAETATGNIAPGQDNLVAAARTNQNHSGNSRVFATSYFEIDLLKGLTFKTLGGLTYTESHREEFQPVNLRTYNGRSNASRGDQFSMDDNYRMSLNIESFLNYHLNFDGHRINLMAGWSASRSDGQRIEGLNVQQLTFPTYRQMAAGTASTLTVSNANLYRSERGESFFGRVIYTFNDKYTINASVRRDGSSNFGPGNRYGTFPAASVLWRISEENFMKSQDIISMMNLRIGWGQSGNAGNSTNRYVPQLSTDRLAYYFYNDSGNETLYRGLAQTRIIDTNLKWETNEVKNFDLEVGFLKNALTVGVEYFVRDAKDLLLNRSVRPSTGYNQVYTNAGHIQNTGFDIRATYRNKSGDWDYSFRLNASTLKNRAIDVGDPILNTEGAETNDQWNDWSRTEDGHAIASWYGYRVTGVFQNQGEIDRMNEEAKTKSNGEFSVYNHADTKPGDFIFKDLDGNGTINENDREFLGHGFPKLIYGLNASVSYKRWDLNIFLNGVAGQNILSYAQRNMEFNMSNGGGYRNILADAYNNRWTEANKSDKYPRLTYTDRSNNRRVSDYFVHKGDFLRVQNIQLGYSLPDNIVRPLRMESLRLNVGVENPFIFTSYKYGNPEIGSNEILRTGLDAGRYPTSTVFNFGLSVGF